MSRRFLVILTAAFLARPAAAASPDFDAAAAEVKRLLGELVAADTTNPPGNEARAAALGAQRLRAAGIPFEVLEFASGRSNLVARLKGSGAAKPLLLLAHIDVVGAGGQPWTSPPHEMTEKDGYLVGRGVGDDLGMAAMELQVLRMLHDSKLPLRRDVILAWTGDEESGGAGVRWLLEKARDRIGDAGLVINEGGGLVLGEDGRAKLVSLQVAEKIYQDFTLRTRGPTGHSSRPLPDNAIYRLARALAKIDAHRFPDRLLAVTRGYLLARAQTESEPLASAMRELAQAKGKLPARALTLVKKKPEVAVYLHTTCVATELTGGTRANALPAEATATVNCRILPDETIDDVRRRLATVIGDPEVEVTPVGQFGSGPPSPLEGEGPAAIAKVMHRRHPGLPIVPAMSVGATDSRFLRELGIPCYGMRTLGTTEEDARRAHGVDERVRVSEIRTGIELMYELVVELAAAP